MYNNIADTIGKTPLICLDDKALNGLLFVKLEGSNPGGSIKDRVALSIIENAEEAGLLSEKSTIIEATSGNTGIALAMISASRGYRCKIVMPENMTVERRKLIANFGAEIILTPVKQGVKGSLEKAVSMSRENPDFFLANQFENPANPAIHEKTTAYEILQDLDERIDYFVAGVGTGGTLTGVGRVLKRKFSNIKIIAVEPAASAVLSGSLPSSHSIQGIGPGFIPKVLDLSLIDRILTIEDIEADHYMRYLASHYGISAGISSGAAFAGCMRIFNENKNANILTIFADKVDKYISYL